MAHQFWLTFMQTVIRVQGDCFIDKRGFQRDQTKDNKRKIGKRKTLLTTARITIFLAITSGTDLKKNFCGKNRMWAEKFAGRAMWERVLMCHESNKS